MDANMPKIPTLPLDDANSRELRKIAEQIASVMAEECNEVILDDEEKTIYNGFHCLNDECGYPDFLEERFERGEELGEWFLSLNECNEVFEYLPKKAGFFSQNLFSYEVTGFMGDAYFFKIMRLYNDYYIFSLDEYALNAFEKVVFKDQPKKLTERAFYHQVTESNGNKVLRSIDFGTFKYNPSFIDWTHFCSLYKAYIRNLEKSFAYEDIIMGSFREVQREYLFKITPEPKHELLKTVLSDDFYYTNSPEPLKGQVIDLYLDLLPVPVKK